MNREDALKILDQIANDPQNWSKQIREAAKAGAAAIKKQIQLEKILKCWQTL